MFLTIKHLFCHSVIITLASICLLFSSTSSAHNKVVVIPLGGDDILPKPLKPLAAISPINTNYQADHSTSILTGGTFQTILDKTTGLMWQRRDDETNHNWHEAFEYCGDLVINYPLFNGNNATLDDWRLPSVTELISIFKDVRSRELEIAIDQDVFEETGLFSYWSNTVYADNSLKAWRVIFLSGFRDGGHSDNISAIEKTEVQDTRCVRGGS